jgi:single-strand DNA-binding protein
MQDMNKLSVVGRLTRDPEMRYTNSGLAILNINIANNFSKKVGDSWQEEVSFFEVSLLGKRAESLQPYLKKGKQIGVSGELRQNRWTNNEGQNRSKIYIVADHIQLFGGSDGSGNNAKQPVTGGASEQFDDDIPF